MDTLRVLISEKKKFPYLKGTVVTQRMEKFLTCIFCYHLRHCFWVWIKNLPQENKIKGSAHKRNTSDFRSLNSYTYKILETKRKKLPEVCILQFSRAECYYLYNNQANQIHRIPLCPIKFSSRRHRLVRHYHQEHLGTNLSKKFSQL